MTIHPSLIALQGAGWAYSCGPGSGGSACLGAAGSGSIRDLGSVGATPAPAERAASPVVQCPLFEVRTLSQHPLLRTSKSYGHWQTNNSSAAFHLKFLNRIRRLRRRNFKWAALVSGHLGGLHVPPAPRSMVDDQHCQYAEKCNRKCDEHGMYAPLLRMIGDHGHPRLACAFPDLNGG